MNSRQINDILVIEKGHYDLDYKFILINWIILVALFVIYVWFFDAMVDKYMEPYDKCMNDDDYIKAKKERKYTKATYMIIIGILSIIGGALLTNLNDLGLIGSTIAVSGGYLVFFNIGENYSAMNKNFVIMSSVISLIVLIYFSINN